MEEQEKKLEFWRELGILAGLEPGSKKELVCAESCDKMFTYLFGDTNRDWRYFEQMSLYSKMGEEFTVIAVPLARRISTYLDEVIEPEFIVDTMKNATFWDLVLFYAERKEFFDYHEENAPNINDIETFMRLKLQGISHINLFDFLEKITNEDRLMATVAKEFNMDFEAFLTALISYYCISEYNRKTK